MGETEIIQELDETPVGKYGFRNRLMKTVDENGMVTYSVRTYAPRPLPLDPSKPFDPDTKYVPARGIDLTEDELRIAYKQLRIALYDARHVPNVKLEDMLSDLETCETVDLSDFDNSVVGDEIYEYDEENEDPVPCEDYIAELGMEKFMPIVYFRKDDNTFKEINLVSWHNNPIVYDFREYRKGINTRGYEEIVPELDKGIKLNDIETEKLCQGIEHIFPELLEETMGLREDDCEDKSTTFRFLLADPERTCAMKALDAVMQQWLEDNLARTKYGERIGEREEDRFFGYLADLRRKIKTAERLSDMEARMCVYVFYTAAEWTDDYPERCMLEDISVRLSDIIEKRKNFSGVEVEQRWLKRITATAGEFGAISDILHVFYKKAYESDEQDKYLLEMLDKIVIYDLETRCLRYLPEDGSYKENAGKKFIKDLIKVFDDVADSPFVEPM